MPNPINKRFGSYLAGGVVLLALLLRIGAAWGPVTVDEAAHWRERVQQFASAVQHGHWADTLLSGHPGVPLLWLGSLGFGLQHVWAPQADDLTQLIAMRLPIAVLNALVVGIGWVLLRRLLDRSVALLAVLLWASDSWLLGYSSLLHLDALVGSFVSLSVLSLLCAVNAPIKRAARKLLLWSGALAGMALLTKSVALLLLPCILLVLLWTAGGATWAARCKETMEYAALWGASAALICFVLWPALWATPGMALWAVAREAVANGGRPHILGSFFWGRAVADPGPLFYPTVLALRAGPLVFGGLLLLPLVWRYTRLRERRVLLLLLLLCSVWLAGLTGQAKKFDRYLVPLAPMLHVVAAIGLVAACRLVVLPEAQRIVAWGTCCLQLVCLVPYVSTGYLSAYNPLLGSGATAQQLLLVGWGEGLDEAAHWITQREHTRPPVIVSSYPEVVASYLPSDYLVLDITKQTTIPEGSYVVLYSPAVQREQVARLAASLQGTMPIYQVTRHGIVYATVYLYHQGDTQWARQHD